ncbi:MAG: hypothetical protein IPM54_16860 [Polyangiaceae bacterium]|nr:hypothetical protein [Polyangiaceae bacterium]
MILSIGMMGLALAAGCLTLTTTPQGGGGSGGESNGTPSSSSGDGAHMPGLCSSVADCPDVKLCETMACMNGACISGFVQAGLQCNNDQVCDGLGSCVDCVKNSDCSGSNASCVDNKCASCSDGIQNGNETGVDCGGSKCAPCAGIPCAVGSDCPTNNCVDGVCCDTSCNTACKACNLTGKEGLCSNLPSGQEDPGVCDVTKACGFNGSCKLKLGQPCAEDSECLSSDCSPDNICEP